MLKNIIEPKRDALSESFIGKQADDLSRLIAEQIKPLYRSLGIMVPVKSCSIIHALDLHQQASVTELAKILDQSHQLVKQKLPRLQQLGFISQHAVAEDRRKTRYRLTREGHQQAQLLQTHSMAHVYRQLSAEVGADLFQVLQRAINQLKQRDLSARFQQTGNHHE